MTERERLIELIRFGYGKGRANENVKQVEETIADYLLANGVIVLPCKVGDMVYGIEEKGICEIEIESIHCWCSGIWKCNGWSGKSKYRVGYEFSFDDIGKTVFLTKEEARKALEENK